MNAQYGLTKEQYTLLESLVVQPLKTLGAEVFIFGSRSNGTHHSHSDIDLLYRLPAGKVISLNQMAVIKEAIEDSRFPFLVDIVNETDLPASYRNDVLQMIVPI